MSKYIRRLRTPLALGLALAAAACTVKDNKSDTTLASDSTLNHDLQLANQDTSLQPQLRDVPATPAATPTPAAATPSSSTPVSRPSNSGRTTTTRPATTTTRPATPTTTTTPSGNTVTRNTPGTSTGGGAVGTIASGTSLALRSNARVCTNTYKVGQTFTASVANAVTGSNGASIPAVADVTLEDTQLKRS